jgi:hypothetical protein
VAGRLGSRPDFDSHIKEGFGPLLDQVFVPNRMVFEWPVEVQSTVFENLVPLFDQDPFDADELSPLVNSRHGFL